jgi:hypothetical protein
LRLRLEVEAGWRTYHPQPRDEDSEEIGNEEMKECDAATKIILVVYKGQSCRVDGDADAQSSAAIVSAPTHATLNTSEGRRRRQHLERLKHTTSSHDDTEEEVGQMSSFDVV